MAKEKIEATVNGNLVALEYDTTSGTGGEVAAEKTAGSTDYLCCGDCGTGLTASHNIVQSFGCTCLMRIDFAVSPVSTCRDYSFRSSIDSPVSGSSWVDLVPGEIDVRTSFSCEEVGLPPYTIYYQFKDSEGCTTPEYSISIADDEECSQFDSTTTVDFDWAAGTLTGGDEESRQCEFDFTSTSTGSCGPLSTAVFTWGAKDGAIYSSGVGLDETTITLCSDTRIELCVKRDVGFPDYDGQFFCEKCTDKLVTVDESACQYQCGLTTSLPVVTASYSWEPTVSCPYDAGRWGPGRTGAVSSGNMHRTLLSCDDESSGGCDCQCYFHKLVKYATYGPFGTPPNQVDYHVYYHFAARLSHSFSYSGGFLADARRRVFAACYWYFTIGDPIPQADLDCYNGTDAGSGAGSPILGRIHSNSCNIPVSMFLWPDSSSFSIWPWALTEQENFDIFPEGDSIAPIQSSYSNVQTSTRTFCNSFLGMEGIRKTGTVTIS